MNKFLSQGRTAKHMHENLAATEMLLLWFIRLVCLALVASAFYGCAEPRIYVENGVRFHEGDTSKCRDRVPGCTVAGEVYYFMLADKYHELDHVKGLTHSEPPFAVAGFSRWTFERGNDSCVKVLTNGSTRWHAGKLLCRHFDNGEYYERSSS